MPIHLKEALKKEIDKLLLADIIKPVKEATLWINSFVFIEGKDKSGNPKLCTCLDQMNIYKAIVHEPYHLKTLEDIAHVIANSCVMTVMQLQKGLLATGIR